MLNIFKINRRYGVFDEKTYGRFIELLQSMTTYTMDSPETSKVVDYYYDSPTGILEQNELLLRRRVMGRKAELKIKRRYFSEKYMYSDSLREHEREKEIAPRDPLSKHYFFLNNALNSMFSNNLQFDPDKLFEQMRVIMILSVKQESRKLFGYGGLKVEVRHEDIKIENKKTGRKNRTEQIQLRLLSGDDTLPIFEDFISRVEKRCKEIFYTRDSKFEIAYRMTKPLPSKEEQQKRNEQLLKQRLEQSANENVRVK